ncbi:Fyve finger-containing protein, partial [Globisporangium polare]
MPSLETKRGTFTHPSKAHSSSNLTAGTRTTLSFDRNASEDSLSMSFSSSQSFDGPIVGPQGGGGRVLIDDDQLLLRAQAAKEKVDFAKLTDLSKCHWKWKDSKNDFTLFTRDLEAEGGGSAAPSTTSHQVLAASEISCSIEELAHILRSSSEVEYNAVMSGLYKKDFIYGSIVHVAPSLVNPANAAEDLSASASSQATSSSLPTEQLTVKTSAFVRSNIFVRNEQWCFLEHFQRARAGGKDAFTLTMSSLLESEITAGKVKKHTGRVDQLHDLVAGYSVERIPSTKSVRVLFHSNFSGENTDVKGNASVSMTKSRIMALAKGVSQLSEVVRRRRLGVQKLADRTAFAAKNTRCICCTKSLHLLSKKKRCYLCGYFVCDKDWSIQKMETRHGHVTTIRVCARCIESVDGCEYADVTPHSLGKASVQPDRESASKAGTALATFLQDALRNSTELKKESVKAVIKHLVNEEQRLSEDSNPVAPVAVLSDASDEKEYISALDKYFQVTPVALENCVLAN